MEVSVKAIKYSEIEPTLFNGETVKGVAGRVAIGKKDGANNFCMRVFEVAPEGNTPKHAHAWEHEMFFHSGEGEVLGNGKWTKVKTGSVVFMPESEEHQVRNTGKEALTFVCLVPSKAPEL
jgi:quercetin dioxygenase-like cupin family protein